MTSLSPIAREVNTDDCMLFAGYKDKWGYGLITWKEGADWHEFHPLVAHRAIYEALVDEIPKGLDLDHLCKIPPCVNPDHLEPVTRAVNLWRRTNGLCKQGHSFENNAYYHVTQAGQKQKSCKTCVAVRGALRKRRLREQQQ